MDTGTSNRLVSYFAIEVNEGDVLTGMVENLDNGSIAKYPLYLDGSDESVLPSVDQTGSTVQEFNVEVSVSGNGAAIGGGSYVSGEFAKVTAVADSGETFLGWYVDNALVSSDAEYRFLVRNDVNIVAKFTGTPDTSNTPSYPSGWGGYYDGSSSGGNSSSTPSYQITAPTPSNGTVTVAPKSAKSGDKVTITATPDEGYITGSVTVTDRNGKDISITDNGDGTYTFTMPASQVTVSVTFTAIETLSLSTDVPGETHIPFTDVLPTDWFYSAVQYVCTNGLMTGDGSTTIFNPNGTMTRAMVWTVLGRMAGADVDGTGNEWYAKAQAWAIANDVSDGTNPNSFAADPHRDPHGDRLG